MWPIFDPVADSPAALAQFDAEHPRVEIFVPSAGRGSDLVAVQVPASLHARLQRDTTKGYSNGYRDVRWSVWFWKSVLIPLFVFYRDGGISEEDAVALSIALASEWPSAADDGTPGNPVNKTRFSIQNGAASGALNHALFCVYLFANRESCPVFMRMVIKFICFCVSQDFTGIPASARAMFDLPLISRNEYLSALPTKIDVGTAIENKLHLWPKLAACSQVAEVALSFSVLIDSDYTRWLSEKQLSHCGLLYLYLLSRADLSQHDSTGAMTQGEREKELAGISFLGYSQSANREALMGCIRLDNSDFVDIMAASISTGQYRTLTKAGQIATVKAELLDRLRYPPFGPHTKAVKDYKQPTDTVKLEWKAILAELGTLSDLYPPPTLQIPTALEPADAESISSIGSFPLSRFGSFVNDQAASQNPNTPIVVNLVSDDEAEEVAPNKRSLPAMQKPKRQVSATKPDTQSVAQPEPAREPEPAPVAEETEPTTPARRERTYVYKALRAMAAQ